MKITGTRSYILVEYDHRTARITGELTIKPEFYANVNSMRYWEPPYDNIEITKAEKEYMINKIKQQNNPDFQIIFE